jgi:hypothetical protein
MRPRPPVAAVVGDEPTVTLRMAAKLADRQGAAKAAKLSVMAAA